MTSQPVPAPPLFTDICMQAALYTMEICLKMLTQ